MLQPNLFLVGAAKGGSSTLAFHLASHPEISMGVKEPNIFNQPTLDDCRARLAAFGHDVAPARWVLDGSVNYTQYPKFTNVPRNIAALSDKNAVRFLYILRNPVDRAISQYFWRRERFGESRPLEEACTEDSLYIMSSRYDVQIAQYLETFEPDQFYFVQHETYFSDVKNEFGKLCDWLGIATDHVPDTALRRGATDKKLTRNARFPWINRIFRSSPALRRLVTRHLPYSVQKKLSNSFSKQVAREEITSEQRTLLYQRLGDSIQRTEALTGFDLSGWRQ